MVDEELDAFVIKDRNPTGKFYLKPKYKGIVAIILNSHNLFKGIRNESELFRRILLSNLDDNQVYFYKSIA